MKKDYIAYGIEIDDIEVFNVLNETDFKKFNSTVVRAKKDIWILIENPMSHTICFKDEDKAKMWHKEFKKCINARYLGEFKLPKNVVDTLEGRRNTYDRYACA